MLSGIPGDKHFRELLRGATAGFGVKTLAAVVSFGFYVLLGRTLGTDGAGLYFLALTVTGIAAVLGRVGLDRALVRFTAAAAAKSDWAAIRGVHGHAVRLTLIWSSVGAILVAASAPLIARQLFNEPHLEPLLRWMSLSVLPLSLAHLNAQALQGLKRVVASMAVTALWIPLLAVGGVLLLVPNWGVQGAVWAHNLASVTTMVISWRNWARATASGRDVAGEFPLSTLMHASIPLLWVALLNLIIVWSSNIMLGIWNDSASVGIFSVANRTASLTGFVLVAVNTIAAPKFAELYGQREFEQLGRTARDAAKLMAALALPALVIFTVFPHEVLSVFGAGFRAGGPVLAILAVGQFVNVTTGSVGQLLIMTGNERLMRNNIAVCAAVNLLLNVTLIPPLGIMGAAIAGAVTLAAQNLIAVALVYHTLGLNPLPLGSNRSRSTEQTPT